MEGQGLPSPLDQARHQLLLGDKAFVEQYKHEKYPEALREVSKGRRRSVAFSPKDGQQRSQSRNERWAVIIDSVHSR